MRSGLYGRLRQISYVLPVAPGQVTGLAAGAPSETSVPLSWPAVAVGTPPLSYRIEYKRAADSEWTLDTVQSGTSRVVSGLQASTAYQFRVRAENAAGVGAYSAVVSASTLADSPIITLTLGQQGVNRGFMGGIQGSLGSATPLVIATKLGNRTLEAAYLQTDYQPANGFRLGFSTTPTDGPLTNLFEYIDVEGIGRLMAADAQWFSPQFLYTWGGIPAGTWTAAGQVRSLTFKLP